MASISGFECLARPGRRDLRQFAQLFLPLFEAATPEARRTASAALSRLATVPADVAEMLTLQPIEIAAPFIAHSPHLSEALLARAIARHGASHARVAARRADLSAAGLVALRALDEPSVNRVLQLRGLIGEQLPAASRPPQDPDTARNPDPVSARRETAATPPMYDEVSDTARQSSDALRDELRQMVLRRPAARAATEADAARLPAPVSPRLSAAHAGRLARFAKPDQTEWFATALADAMASSFALAERIMLDISGRQLAATLVALGVDETVGRAALEAHFPPLAEASGGTTRAARLLAGLDRDECAARLDAWLRADRYTSASPVHVPVLVETRPDRDRRPEGRLVPRLHDQDAERPDQRPGQRSRISK
ncbi:uncharacterized protein (DUF2336 family) [Hoeflea marina]|uniref:Uncharacterized protein (DUF2336 family) n=2 Tax=Hoeflea marina TaxID=274592 RepID=A0A317PN66_9HYPH|nr:uncharacterized protein (DUF2336 family) [Hoeflea marina]